VRADRRPPGAGVRVSILDTLKRLTGVSTVRTGPTEEGAMKYLCLAYYDEQKFATLSEAELDAIGRACRPYDDALGKSGHLIATGSLQPARSTTTLRPRHGRASVTDGPFVETKEQVGGFFIIEARDQDEALRVASQHPAAHMNEHLGWALELRPIEIFGTDSLTCRLDKERSEQPDRARAGDRS
jgi:hypothetical protein